MSRLVASLAIFVLLIAPGVTSADTMVGGFIASDTHWTVSGSPYIVAANIVVDNNATLTIDPSVEVRVDPEKKLTFQTGKLVARGTAAENVRFTQNLAGDANRWGGIQFAADTADATFDGDGSYLDGSIIEFSVVEYATNAIRAEYCSPYVANSSIRDNSGTGIYTNNANDIRVVGNAVSDNAAGVKLYNSREAFVSGNTISRNKQGIYVSSGPDTTISDNIITNNTGTSRGAGMSIYKSANSIISGNTITGNSATDNAGGLRLYNSDNTLVSNNVITGNDAVNRGGGAYVYSSVDVSFEQNRISDNSAARGAGLWTISSYRLSFTADRITENTGIGIWYEGGTGIILSSDPDDPTWILGNTEDQIYNDDDFRGSWSPAAAGNIDARNVWWGTVDSFEIEQGVYHYIDDDYKGIVFTQPFATVPEPSTFVLLAIGTVGLAAFGRRRRKSAR